MSVTNHRKLNQVVFLLQDKPSMEHTALLSLALLVTSVIAESGFVSELFEDKRRLCSNMEMKVYTVSSEIQCIHRCLRHDKCEAANYNKQSTKKNCEVSLHGTCLSFVKGHAWKSLLIEVRSIFKFSFLPCR